MRAVLGAWYCSEWSSLCLTLLPAQLRQRRLAIEAMQQIYLVPIATKGGVDMCGDEIPSIAWHKPQTQAGERAESVCSDEILQELRRDGLVVLTGEDGSRRAMLQPWLARELPAAAADRRKR